MNFIVINQEHLQQIQLYIVLKPSSLISGQPFMFTEKYILCWNQNMQQVS
jgi:hypothetical protein